jgi:hypothetical protein
MDAPAMAKVVPSDSIENPRDRREEGLQKATVTNEIVELYPIA